MSFLNKWTGKKEKPVNSYAEFWNWFLQHEKKFHKTVSSQGNIEKEFFNKVSPKLELLHDGLWLLAGMCDDNTVELVITVDGSVKNMVFAEDIVAAAPALPGWKFTALKPAIDSETMEIEMHGYRFGQGTMQFYPIEQPDYPDAINICIVHNNYAEETKEDIEHGVNIFLDNYLGELEFATVIDALDIEAPAQAATELIPLHKLKSYLSWRQKEFVEKYEDSLCDTENFTHSIFEAPDDSEEVFIAVVNTELLGWENKASHPWIAVVQAAYDGRNTNGLPDEETQALLGEIEERLLALLPDKEGYLWIGHDSKNGNREIWFACREFRKPSRVLWEIVKEYADRQPLEFHFYKDKYWKMFEGFQ